MYLPFFCGDEGRYTFYFEHSVSHLQRAGRGALANFPIPISVPHELGLKSGLKGEIEKQLELLINCELDDFKWIASDDQEKFERKIGQLAINLFMGD